MVRVKHRYLLVEILYPNERSSSSLSLSTHLQLHAPTPDSLTPGLLANLLRDEIASIFGDWGVGRIGGGSALSIKYLSPATSTAIIRCPRAAFRLVWAALTFLSSVPEPDHTYRQPHRSSSQSRGGEPRPCVFRVLRVSGTMRKAGEEAVRRARREIVRVKNGEGVAVSSLLVGIQDGNGDTAGEGNESQGTQEEEQLAKTSPDSLSIDDSSDDNEQPETRRRKPPRAGSRNDVGFDLGVS
ncbi:hypothetical protein Egran_03310 [Elaphomyces granulatus]|uniref:Uncharacterized protein n=1 Tax=Elaphomyces granulatus TaxID=519963 RepID=A0A232LXN1_9EURO|nr:hypothetical protein Egran_03310 [Elaphomyces granulatus]